MNPSEDKPRLEVFPWAFVLLLPLFWCGLWFLIWATLRGSAASLVIAYSSIRNLSYFPWLVPGQLVLWLAALAWLFHDLKLDKNPPLIAWALGFLLPLTLPPTAFFLLGRIGFLSEYELSRNPTSLFFQHLLQGTLPDVVALSLSVPIGAYANLRALRQKYPGLRPQKRAWIGVGWAIAVGVAIGVGTRWGTLWGFLFLTVSGNFMAICGYRATIRQHIRFRGFCGT